MKKNYNELLIKVRIFQQEDVITTSPVVDVEQDENELPFVPFFESGIN